MRRLKTRIAVGVAAGVLLIITLLVSVQLFAGSVGYRSLSPEFRSQVALVLRDPSLSTEESIRRMQTVVADYLATEAGFEDMAESLARWRLLRNRGIALAALVSVVLGIVAALGLAQFLASTLMEVSRAARAIREGDYSARARAPRILAGKTDLAEFVIDFNAMADSIERLERERKSLVADVAHELRTPLTVLQGQLDAMQYGVLPSDGEQLAKASKQAELLSRLVKDLRLLSLAESARLTLDRRPLDLNSVLEDIIDGFQDQARATGATVEFIPGKLPLLELDQDRIAQVAINLIANALRHAAPNGRVEVRTVREDDEAGFLVTDDGAGLSPEVIAMVFDRFFRTDAGRSRDQGGSGLGLAIVKAIVELHGGRVAAGNRLEGGAQFEVWLPVAPAGTEAGEHDGLARNGGRKQ